MVGVVAIAAVATSAAVIGPAKSVPPIPWTRLATSDVHSLGFAGPSGASLLFGHHDGVLRSDDGGISWVPTAFTQDAMGMATSTNGSVAVAGHEVFQESLDDGRTWSPVATDLPTTDIHAFARSPMDPSRMWAYLAEGGVYESRDSGRRWVQVFDGDVFALVVVGSGPADELLGVDPFRGLVRSDDGGRQWRATGGNPASPVTSLAATSGAGTVLVGGPDGLFRSDDGGRSFRGVLASGAVLAVATAQEGDTLVAVTDQGLVYRSDDGGVTWPGPP